MRFHETREFHSKIGDLEEMRKSWIGVYREYLKCIELIKADSQGGYPGEIAEIGQNFVLATSGYSGRPELVIIPFHEARMKVERGIAFLEDVPVDDREDCFPECFS